MSHDWCVPPVHTTHPRNWREIRAASTNVVDRASRADARGRARARTRARSKTFVAFDRSSSVTRARDRERTERRGRGRGRFPRSRDAAMTTIATSATTSARSMTWGGAGRERMKSCARFGGVARGRVARTVMGTGRMPTTRAGRRDGETAPTRRERTRGRERASMMARASMGTASTDASEASKMELWWRAVKLPMYSVAWVPLRRARCARDACDLGGDVGNCVVEFIE